MEGRFVRVHKMKRERERASEIEGGRGGIRFDVRGQRRSVRGGRERREKKKRRRRARRRDGERRC
uniref:Uncharacterized protein n=1 Tax=Cucumis melo TaxID=3656 RepID=A0A9I9CCY9_CUCME